MALVCNGLEGEQVLRPSRRGAVKRAKLTLADALRVHLAVGCEESSDMLTEDRISLVASRLHHRLEQATPKNSRDEIVRSKLRKNALGKFTLTASDMAVDLCALLSLMSAATAADVDSVGASFTGGQESAKIIEIREQFAIMEYQYFDIESKRDFQDRLLEKDADGNIYSTVVLWSGSEAMEAAVADDKTLSNFRVPVINLMFMIWEELFCDSSEARAAILTDLSTDDLSSVSTAINQLAKKCLSSSSADSAAFYSSIRNLFGDYLSEENLKVAATFGMVVSRIFVSTFLRPEEDGGKLVVYFSDNKQDYKNNPTTSTAPVLDVTSIAVEREVPLAMACLSKQAMVWKWVAWGNSVQVNPADIEFVQSRDNPNVLHNRQQIFSVGMASPAEFKLFSHQGMRPRVALAADSPLIPLFQ